MSTDFVIDCNLFYQRPEIKISELQVVGYNSFDKYNTCNQDLSQLLYYNPPPQINWKRLKIDLDENFETIVKKPINRYGLMKNDNLLNWILLNADKIKAKPEEGKRLDTDFVAYNGTFTKLLRVPYELKHGWTICAAKFQGNIYLSKFETEDDKRWATSGKYEDKRFLWGYKFKQFIFSEEPNKQPNSSRSLNEAEKFYCFFQSKLGDHKLLYRAEVDGVKSKKKVEEPINWNKVKFVETRTSYIVQTGCKQKFIRRSFINWWTQCCLIEVDHVLCGFRNQEGIVNEVRSFRLEDFVNMAKLYWDPNVCFHFLHEFLSYLKATVVDDYEDCIYKFEWQPGWTKIKVEEVSSSSECAFLSESFIKGMNNN